MSSLFKFANQAARQSALNRMRGGTSALLGRMAGSLGSSSFGRALTASKGEALQALRSLASRLRGSGARVTGLTPPSGFPIGPANAPRGTFPGSPAPVAASGLPGGPPALPGRPPGVPGPNPPRPLLPPLLQPQRPKPPPSYVPTQRMSAGDQLLDLAGDIQQRTYIGEQEAERLIDRITSLLRDASHDTTITLPQRDGLTEIAEILAKRFTSPAKAPPAQATEEDRDEETPIEVLGRGDIGAWPDIDEFVAGERLTPNSSNVFSYFWKPDGPISGKHPVQGNRNGTLFVTFKLWHPGMAKGARPNQAGPMYAYSNVPLSKYVAFENSATGSAGSAVWDYLRVRGSRSGHQHPYRLVAGALVPHGGQYVPRKATAKGYRSRSLATPKRRGGGVQRSTLAPQRFTRAEPIKSHADWRRIAAERNAAFRARPKRGRPATGRT